MTMKRFARYFHRILVKDEVGVLTKLTAIYSNQGASLATVVQHPDKKESGRGTCFHHTPHVASTTFRCYGRIKSNTGST